MLLRTVTQDSSLWLRSSVIDFLTSLHNAPCTFCFDRVSFLPDYCSNLQWSRLLAMSLTVFAENSAGNLRLTICGRTLVAAVTGAERIVLDKSSDQTSSGAVSPRMLEISDWNISLNLGSCRRRLLRFTGFAWVGLRNLWRKQSSEIKTQWTLW